MAPEPDGSKKTVDPLSDPHVREELHRLQSENTALRRENAQLRQQLQPKEDWENQKTQYQHEQTEGGAVVYGFTGTPKHYACPSCFSKQALQFLQEKHAASGTFECPGCRASYPIKPAARPPKPVLRKASLWSS
jgi:cell division septum initiation protein DivIVA